MGLIMSSGLLRLWTYRVLDKFFTFELSVTDDQKVRSNRDKKAEEGGCLT